MATINLNGEITVFSLACRFYYSHFLGLNMIITGMARGDMLQLLPETVSDSPASLVITILTNLRKLMLIRNQGHRLTVLISYLACVNSLCARRRRPPHQTLSSSHGSSGNTSCGLTSDLICGGSNQEMIAEIWQIPSYVNLSPDGRWIMDWVSSFD